MINYDYQRNCTVIYYMHGVKNHKNLNKNLIKKTRKNHHHQP